MATPHVVNDSEGCSESAKTLRAVEAERKPDAGKRHGGNVSSCVAEHHSGTVEAHCPERDSASELVTKASRNGLSVGTGEGSDDVEAAGPALTDEHASGLPDGGPIGLAEASAAEDVGGLVDDYDDGTFRNDPGVQCSPVVAALVGDTGLPGRERGGQASEYLGGFGECSDLNLVTGRSEVEFLRVDDDHAPAPAQREASRDCPKKAGLARTRCAGDEKVGRQQRVPHSQLVRIDADRNLETAVEPTQRRWRRGAPVRGVE